MALLLNSCAAKIPAAPTDAFLGISTGMSLTDARRALKSQGYIITGKDSDGPLHRISYAAKNLGAVFSSVEILACGSSENITGIYFSGESKEAVLSAARNQLELSRINTVSSPPAVAAPLGGYRPQYYSLYKDSIKVALYTIEKTGTYGVSLEKPDMNTACRGSQQEELRAEQGLFAQIQKELRQAGVSSFIAKGDPAVAGLPAEAAGSRAAAQSAVPLTRGTSEAALGNTIPAAAPAGSSAAPGLETLPVK